MALKRKLDIPLTFEYIPNSQKGEKDPFTVSLKRLSPKEYALIEDKLIQYHQDEVMTFSTSITNFTAVQNSLINWKNMLGEDNKPISPKFNNGLLDEKSLELIPMPMITEIANVVVGISKDPENADQYLGNIKDPALATSM